MCGLFSGCAQHGWVPAASVDLKSVPVTSYRDDRDSKTVAGSEEEKKGGLVRDVVGDSELLVWLKWKNTF